MARRLSSPVFVGRRDELQTLVAAADVAASGGAALVLVGGEAGVGKSRLVAEAAASLRDRDWLVLEGGTVALGDDGLPFGPIVQALRALVRDVDPDRIALAAGPTLPELARLVPELSMVAGDGARPGRSRRMAPDPHLRGDPATPGPARRGIARPADHRGPALGRSLDPRPARVPRPQRSRRTPAHRRHLPDRRAPPPASADELAGRGGTPAARRTRRPPAFRARRAGRAAGGHHRRDPSPDAGRFGRPSVRWQRVLRRGAGRRRRRDGPAS